MVNNGGGYMLIASHIDQNSSQALNELDDEVRNSTESQDAEGDSEGEGGSNANRSSQGAGDGDGEIFPQFVSEEDAVGNNLYKILKWSNVWNNMKSV